MDMTTSGNAGEAPPLQQQGQTLMEQVLKTKVCACTYVCHT